MALALMALFDPNADEEERFRGGLVFGDMAKDMHFLRLGMVEVK